MSTMRRMELWGMFLLGAFFVAPTWAENGLPIAEPEEVGMDSERLAKLGALMQQYVDDGQLAGTVTLVARKGKVVHFESHGHRYREEKVPMTNDTIFRIASMTKPITSVSLMMLFEDGLFALDDPVEKWLPGYANPTGRHPRAAR